MVVRRFARVLVAVMFVAWSAALTVTWWHRALRTDQTLITLGFVVAACLVWWGILSAVAGKISGAGFALLAAVIWWVLRYLGRVGSGAGEWLLLAEDLWGAGLACCLVIAKLQPWRRRRPASADDDEIRGTREWGTPGRTGESAGPFAADNGGIGRGADAQVVARLKELTTQDSVRYLHGLRFSTAGDDVDHAVVVGNRVALINVRAWRPGMYSWAGPLRVQYYGERFQGGSAEISTAAIQCRITTGLDAGVRAWLVLAPMTEAGKHTYVLDNTGAPEGVSLCLTEDLEAVGEWLAGAPDAIDLPVVRALVDAHRLYASDARPVRSRRRRRIRIRSIPGLILRRITGRQPVDHRPGITS